MAALRTEEQTTAADGEGAREGRDTTQCRGHVFVNDIYLVCLQHKAGVYHSLSCPNQCYKWPRCPQLQEKREVRVEWEAHGRLAEEGGESPSTLQKGKCNSAMATGLSIP